MITDNDNFRIKAVEIIKHLEGLNGYEAKEVLSFALKILPLSGKVDTTNQDFLKIVSTYQICDSEQT